MDAVISQITDEMEQHHYKFKMVPITHLAEVQDAVGELVRQGMISETLSRGWHFYLDGNEKLPEAKTIAVIAMPQYITRVTFRNKGKVFAANIPPGYFTQKDESCADKILRGILEPNGYKLSKARLPLKTLAVRSGLAKYGRNNISYVPGMGSFLRLIAFYTDYVCDENSWQEAVMMKICEKCFLCRERCPTGCIPDDRVVIHAENCQTHFNETDEDLHGWLKSEWHNELIGCMECQQVCPVNKPFLNKIADGPDFSEEETELILNRTAVEKLDIETQRKLEHVIQDGLYPYVGRNLSVLIEKHRKEI
jgi:epoxyqueuosine reductase